MELFFQARYMTQGLLIIIVEFGCYHVIDKFTRNWISKKSAFTLPYTLNEVKAWKNVPQNNAKKQCQDKYKQSMSKQPIKADAKFSFGRSGKGQYVQNASLIL